MGEQLELELQLTVALDAMDDEGGRYGDDY